MLSTSPNSRTSTLITMSKENKKPLGLKMSESITSYSDMSKIMHTKLTTKINLIKKTLKTKESNLEILKRITSILVTVSSILPPRMVKFLTRKMPLCSKIMEMLLLLIMMGKSLILCWETIEQLLRLKTDQFIETLTSPPIIMFINNQIPRISTWGLKESIMPRNVKIGLY